jgi:phenylalanyl-tRNA synthetase alpha chain
MSDLEKINSSFIQKIETVESKEDLQNLKTEFFGKNGQITSQFKKLGSLRDNNKKEFAS